MAFVRKSAECSNYLSKGFKHYSNPDKVFKKAEKVLDYLSKEQKNYDMFFNDLNNSIVIIPKNVEAEYIMCKKSGGTIIEIPQNEKYPNKIEVMLALLEELNKSEIGPRNFAEKYLFKIFSKFQMLKSKRYVDKNPYECLPGNVRKALDVVKELEDTIRKE